MRKRFRSLTGVRAAAVLVTLALATATAARPEAAPPLPLATPESQGMSSERLGASRGNRAVRRRRPARGRGLARRPEREDRRLARVWQARPRGRPAHGEGHARPHLLDVEDRDERRRAQPARGGAVQARRPHRRLPARARPNAKCCRGARRRSRSSPTRRTRSPSSTSSPTPPASPTTSGTERREALPAGEAVRGVLARRLRGAGLAAAPRPRARRALHLRRLDRRPRRPRGEGLGPEPSGLLEERIFGPWE